MKIWVGILSLISIMSSMDTSRTDVAKFPEIDISNGIVKAKLYLPDPVSGFYRSTRFDWSGSVSSLEYDGHTFFGQWFKIHDPSVRDVEFRPELDGFAAGTPSANMGPVEEFSTPLGYDEAAIGGTFIKIGVGILRKPEEPRYSWATRYEIVDPGKWGIRKTPQSVEFTHEITDTSGYGYQYAKTLLLPQGRPELVLEHSLKNTGRRAIDSIVYNHNFLVMDGRPSGPDFLIGLPFDIQSSGDKLGVLAPQGKDILFLRELVKDERASLAVTGFSNSAGDYDIRVENRSTGTGVRITADRPLVRFLVWSVRPTRCPEPFIALHVEPGAGFTWRISYEFYRK
jgi:hypothetical protein